MSTIAEATTTPSRPVGGALGSVVLDSAAHPTARDLKFPSTAFLLGLPRSGSTLLSFLLAGLPHSLSLSEPYLAQDIFPHWLLRRYFRNIERSVPLSHVKLPNPCSPVTLLDHMRRVAIANGLSYLLIKETYRHSREWKNAHLLERLARGGHRLVALHRHPYDITVSSLKFCKWWRGVPGHLLRVLAPRLPLFPTDRAIVEHCADNWVNFAAFCRRHRLYAVRYEDLVVEPEPHVRAVCGALDLPFHEAMLDHTRPRSAFGGIGAPEVLNRPPRPVNRESVGRKHLLSDEFQKIIAGRCATEATALGYTL